VFPRVFPRGDTELPSVVHDSGKSLPRRAGTDAVEHERRHLAEHGCRRPRPPAASEARAPFAGGASLEQQPHRPVDGVVVDRADRTFRRLPRELARRLGAGVGRPAALVLAAGRLDLRLDLLWDVLEPRRKPLLDQRDQPADRRSLARRCDCRPGRLLRERLPAAAAEQLVDGGRRRLLGGRTTVMRAGIDRPILSWSSDRTVTGPRFGRLGRWTT
jgi:hypothetical protein